MDLIRICVVDLQNFIRILPDVILDYSIEGANFDINYDICNQHYLVIESSRNKQHNTNQFFLRVFNYYCLKNVLSCRNTIPDDFVYIQKKHAKEIYTFLSNYLQENTQTPLRYEIIHLKTYIAMLTN